MENQNPSLEEIGQMLQAGNVTEANAALGREMPVEPVVETPTPDESEFVTIEPEQAPEAVVEQPQEAPAEESDEFVNGLDEQRKIFDQLEAERIEKEKTLKAELEAQKEAAAKEREALLKQVEEARMAATQAKDEEEKEFSYFDDPEADSGKPVAEATAPVVNQSPESTDDLLAEFKELKSEMAAQKAMDDSARQYTSFWNSPEGEALKPKGMDASTAIRTLDSVYDNLTRKFSNETEAMRALYDLRNPETAEIYKDKLGVEVPKEFDKLYDSWAVSLYKNGKKLDPVTGRVVETASRQETMEDAYYLMNKQKMMFDAKMEAFKEIQTKVDERNNSAQIPNPAQMQSFSTERAILDPGHTQGVLQALKKVGYKMGDSLNKIADPELRRQAAEIKQLVNF